MIVYLNGTYLDKDDARISPNDRGFLFADGLYEVVRYYNGKPFRLKGHQNRLENGARFLRYNRTKFSEFQPVLEQLQSKNKLHSVNSSIVYFQVTRGVAPRSHSFPAKETPLTVYAFAKEFTSHQDEQSDGAAAITVSDDRWSNCHIKSIALLPNTLAHQLARDNNAIEAIFIRDNIVQEGTHSNICIYKDGIVKTSPLSNFILPGITRKAVLELCQQLSIPFAEEPVQKAELLAADEVFIVGTTVEITPIINIDGKVIGSGKPGTITEKLLKLFMELVKG